MDRSVGAGKDGRRQGAAERALAVDPQGAVERLSLDQVRAPSLIATDHLHRYELVAELCRGRTVADVCCGVGYGSRLLREAGAERVVGVDADAAAIEAARAATAGLAGIELQIADAAEYLEGPEAAELDAIVIFEGLEHVPDPERVLAALRRLVAGGAGVAVSIPNSRELGEQENPFHHTDYDFESAMSALRGLGGDVKVLYQFAAEGSLIRGEPGSLELEVHGMLEGRGEPELAGHFIALAGFGAAAERADARLLLGVAPVHRRYMTELQAANDRLWTRISELESRLERIESSALWRASRPLRSARRRLRR